MTDEEKRPEEEAADSEEASTEGAASTSESEAPESEAPESETMTSASAEQPAESSNSEEAGDSDDVAKSDDAAESENAATPEVAAAASHGHGGHGDDHFAHTAPWQMLVAVFGALIVLTVLTVAVTAIDLGSSANFVVAMVIATVKAVLVMGFFMHMIWDNKFNVVAFTSSFLFVMLFLAMALTDRGEYQDSMDEYENDQKAAATP